MPATKEEKAQEEARLTSFAEKLLDCWTAAGNTIAADANHYSAFGGIVHEEAEFLEYSLQERFPGNPLLVKACIASVAACIARMLVADAVK
jgi:hypothetical protein